MTEEPKKSVLVSMGRILMELAVFDTPCDRPIEVIYATTIPIELAPFIMWTPQFSVN